MQLYIMNGNIYYNNDFDKMLDIDERKLYIIIISLIKIIYFNRDLIIFNYRS